MRYRGPILFIFLLSLACTLFAVNPQFWENFTQDDLLRGSLTRVSLSAEGRLSLAPAYDLFYDTGQPYVFSMARDKAGNLYLGTGHEGKVFRVDPQGKGSLYFQSKELDIFALALDAADVLYVGTSPDGKVYKVSGQNQATEFCNPDEKYIWSLLFDDAGNLYVGTGGHASVLKVNRNGEKSTFYALDDGNVSCLARAGNGNLLIGTSPGGMLIEVNPQGKGFTLLDTPLEEIRSIAIDRFGTIYAAAASSKSGVKAAGPVPPNPPAGGAMPVAAIQMLANLADRSREAQTSITAPGGGKDADGAKSSIIAIAKSGSAETVYASEDRMVYDLLIRGDDTLLAATGGKGRLLAIDTAKQVSVVTDSPEEQTTRLIAAADAVFVAGSNQGRVYRLQSQRAQNGTFESRVMDAKVISSWGHISWRYLSPSGGNVKISTRTGNTEKPEGSWSDWSSPYSIPSQQITNPKARYLQWRAVFERGSKPGAIDYLERVQIPYLQENLRPQVVSMIVLPAGVTLQKTPTLSVGTVGVNLSSTTGDGQSLNSPRQRGRESPAMPPRQVLQPGAQSFTWRATDDNEDTLEYSIYFKGEGESDWKLLGKDISETFYTLDGTALPDGVYTLKVVASDAPSNPYGKALIGELISKPFVISNATPMITLTSHKINGRRVEALFHARVGAGRIVSGEFSVDGGEWFLVFPADGIADSAEEDFQVATPDLTPGEHLIGVRASDANGNTGTAKLVVKIQ
jgi:sugar lactone lactonase YvrE